MCDKNQKQTFNCQLLIVNYFRQRRNWLNVKCQMSNVGERGFSLLELVIVLAIFMVAITTAVSIFASIVSQQRRILDEEELLSQASYALEYMSRAIRAAVKDDTGSCLGDSNIGYNYVLTNYDSASGFYEGIKFINQSNSNACQEFFIDLDGALKEIKNAGSAQSILSNAYNIKYGRFILNKNVQGSSPDDLVQPRVTILLNIQTKAQNPQEKIIQTTISQRNLNVQ